MERHAEVRRAAAAIDDRGRAPTTVAPAARATSIVSRVEPPVVTTSSTTSTLSSGLKREATPQRQPAVLPLGEDRAHAERARHLVADDDAAERRREHDRRAVALERGAERFTERRRVARVLEHERALQVPGAVQTRRQTEVAFEQGAGLAEQMQELVVGHRRRVPKLARTAPDCGTDRRVGEGLVYNRRGLGNSRSRSSVYSTMTSRPCRGKSADTRSTPFSHLEHRPMHLLPRPGARALLAAAMLLGAATITFAQQQPAAAAADAAGRAGHGRDPAGHREHWARPAALD